MIVIDVQKTEKSWWAEEKKDSRYSDVVETFYVIDKHNPNISWETIYANKQQA